MAEQPVVAEDSTFDVRVLTNLGLARAKKEMDWINSHEGALAASRIGGCLRQEKLRLLKAPAVDKTTPRSRRRMAAGLLFEDSVYRRLLDADRRPKRQQEVELTFEGMTLLGSADFVLTEGVVEVKTTSRYTMDEEMLPFGHLIQLGCYQYGIQRPGQLLYIGQMGAEEWAFDFTALPEVWEPWMANVVQLFTDHPGDDVTPFPAERQWCNSCDYLEVCPQDTFAAEAEAQELDEAQRTLLLQQMRRYHAAKVRETAAEAEAKAARQGVLGFQHLLPRKGRRASFAGDGMKLTITPVSPKPKLDTGAAVAMLETRGLVVPMTSPKGYDMLRVTAAGEE